MTDKKPHWSSDPYWIEALESYQSLRNKDQGILRLDLSTIETSLFDGGSPAYKLLESMHSVQEHESQEGNKGAPRLVLALLAKLAEQASPDATAVAQAEFRAPLQISLTPNKSQLIRRCTRLLSMVHELHKAGYQLLRAIPYLHFDNGCWRCPLTVADNITVDASEKNGFCIQFRDASLTLESSNGGVSSFERIANSETMSARELAAAFIKHFPELAKSCEGQDWAYAGWLTSILGVAESGLVPVLFGPRNDLVAVVPPPPPRFA